MEQNINRRLHPDSDNEDDDYDDYNDDDYNNDTDNDDEYIEEDINNININQNENEDQELKRTIEISIQEYENSIKLVKDTFQQIINMNIETHETCEIYEISDNEMIKSLLLENLTDNEREQVLKMLQEYNYNKLARELIEQQKIDYEMSLQQDIIKQEEKQKEIKEEIILTKEQLREERLKFFQKK
jgi:topoisomerase-4 subunit A